MSLGASAPLDYLVESILVPDAKQKEGFVSMQVLTKSGDILSGVRVRQTDKELVLRDAARDEMIIPLTSIELKKEIGSIMPAGLADLLTDAEFLDLVRFLSELGKVGGPYAPSKARIVRQRTRLAGASRCAFRIECHAEATRRAPGDRGGQCARRRRRIQDQRDRAR
jgi:putative heme-binding domain-containing protein